MPEFEYRLVEAGGSTLNGARRGASPLAPLEQMINEYAREGWEFLRFEALSIRRARMFRSDRTDRVLVAVFRRRLGERDAPGPALVLTGQVPGSAGPSATEGSERQTEPAATTDPPRIEDAVAGVRGKPGPEPGRFAGLRAVRTRYEPPSDSD